MRRLLSVGALFAASILMLSQPKTLEAKHHRDRVVIVEPDYHYYHHHHHHHYRYYYYPYY